jgi:hypothetical protein
LSELRQFDPTSLVAGSGHISRIYEFSTKTAISCLITLSLTRHNYSAPAGAENMAKEMHSRNAASKVLYHCAGSLEGTTLHNFEVHGIAA